MSSPSGETWDEMVWRHAYELALTEARIAAEEVVYIATVEQLPEGDSRRRSYQAKAEAARARVDRAWESVLEERAIAEQEASE